MKTLMITLTFVAVAVLPGISNDGKYIEAMQKNIRVVYEAKSVAELQNAVNAFERIGNAEQKKWEPQYYAAFGYIMMANYEKDVARKDVYLDQATAALNKAKVLVPEESEVVALEGFIYMIRITVDPASRGQQYALMSMGSFSKATALNPENPRALALLAQMQYGTAQFFGSATTEACATIDKAITKFETFKSDNPLAPQWGKAMAQSVKEKCK